MTEKTLIKTTDGELWVLNLPEEDIEKAILNGTFLTVMHSLNPNMKARILTRHIAWFRSDG